MCRRGYTNTEAIALLKPASIASNLAVTTRNSVDSLMPTATPIPIGASWATICLHIAITPLSTDVILVELVTIVQI